MTSDNQLGVRIWYYNFGKSPALHIERAGWIFSGNDAVQQADDWFRQLGDKPLPEQGSFIGESTLMQGEPPVANLLPGKNRGASLDAPYVVAMRVQYFDAFGNRYWSDICFWPPFSDMSQNISNRCMNHNEIH